MNTYLNNKIVTFVLLFAMLLAPQPFLVASASQVRPLPNAAVLPAITPACAPITQNTTWTTGNVYVVENCNLVVQVGATLTLQPGVVVKFGGTSPGYGSTVGSAALIVQGTLQAIGTAAQPVVFTSLSDDAHGGDTNANGSSSGAASDWYGVVFQAGSSGQIENFFVGYAGSGVFNATLGYGRAQIDVRQGAVQLRQGVITTGARRGIYLDGTDITPVITDVQILNNIGPAGYTLRGDAIYQSSLNMQPTFSGNSFSGNSYNQVTIDLNTAMTRTVTLGGAPYGFLCGYTLCQWIVPSGVTLGVSPGTFLDFGPSYGITIASGGTLVAEGTATQPITFTSTLAAANPQANQQWIGLWAQQGSTLRLDRCDISYGSDGNFGNGGLEINTDNAQVRNCRIHHNKQTGLYLYSRDGVSIHPTLTNVEVTDNGQVGVYFETSYGSTNAVTWDGGTISRNGWAGISGSTWFSSIAPTLRNLSISNNGTQGTNDDQRRGINFNNNNMNPVLEYVTFSNNVGAAIVWYCNGSITARNLTATGNGVNALQLSGCGLSSGRQWDLGATGIPVQVTGRIDVAGNSLLSLMPGTELRFEKQPNGALSDVQVREQATLSALGTITQPITFTGAITTPGSWGGIYATGSGATLLLKHCDIGYGGGSFSGNLLIYGHMGTTPAPVQIQNCAIHDSLHKGVHFQNWESTPPVFQQNRIYDNAEEGVANWGAPMLDARNTWWGAASGPHHATQNPTGQGDDVGDNVIFSPWLTAPPTGAVAPGTVLISTGAPSQVSPGESVDYAIQYVNQMTQTVHSAILMLQLPQASFFEAGTSGAIYWPERHQVIWKLGEVAPEANSFVSVRVRFRWGLATNYTDGSYTRFAGTNYHSAVMDVAEYNAYQSSRSPVTSIVNLSAAEFATTRATSADFESLYQAALTEGFQYVSAARFTYQNNRVVVNAALRTANRQFGRILSLNSDGRVLASTVSGSGISMQDMHGGLRADLTTQTYTFWGDWQAPAAQGALNATGTCTERRCFYNCMLKAKTWGAVAGKVAGLVSWVMPPLGVVWTTYEAYDEVTTYLDCEDNCRLDPTTHCCTSGETRWSPTGLKQQCARYSCDAVSTWKQTPDIIETCGFGQRCVAGKGSGGGCKDCEESLLATQFTPVSLRANGARDGACKLTATLKSCDDVSMRQARDPNAIYGPAGDLLPNATIVYTITYENEGAGRAYGVYVLNPLPAVFNAATVNLYGHGSYLPESREIAWLVGELGPKGANDSQGVITYTVTLTGSLPSGTVVTNQATVYFPSVPETTPTNTWVNLVAPLTGLPQNVSTAYQTAVPITLSGREVSGLPLTFDIVEPPRNGTLTGTAPSLTYTPGAGFTGPDSFTFQVRNGTSTSRIAQVLIEVTPVGDKTPPQVLWSNPAADTSGVVASASPVMTDTVGPIYSPVIMIGFSEALSETTVTTMTVTLARNNGAAVASSVAFDAASNQIVLTPRTALAPGEYVLTVTSAVTDRAGNPLARNQRRFSIGTTTNHYVYMPMLQR
ncbi:MAG: right-handed parallel beta-helix repeat-containing protein [Chloroflexales bacterium]